MKNNHCHRVTTQLQLIIIIIIIIIIISPEVKRPDRGGDYPPHLALRLKKEQNYTSGPS